MNCYKLKFRLNDTSKTVYVGHSVDECYDKIGDFANLYFDKGIADKIEWHIVKFEKQCMTTVKSGDVYRGINNKALAVYGSIEELLNSF